MTDSTYDTAEEMPSLPRKRIESPTLFSELLPDPSTHPRASLRALSTGIVCTLIFVALWLGCTQDRPAILELIGRGQGWTKLDSIPFRLRELEVMEIAEDDRTDSVWAGEWSDTEKDGASEVAETGTSRAAKVNGQLLDGSLSSYVWHQSMSWNSTGSESTRLIVVGDIHGKHESLSSLLDRLPYSNSTDTLIHVGDLVGKSPLNDSLETVKMMRSLKSRGVRGNHDQGVIEWRNILEAYGPNLQLANATESNLTTTSDSPTFSTAKHLSHLLDHDSLSTNGALLGKDWSWLDVEEAKLKELGVELPSTWIGKTGGWGGDWFEIARHLPKEDFDYLKSLPLTLFVPEMRSYIVHAGMLPWTSPPLADEFIASNSTNSTYTSLSSHSKLIFNPAEGSNLTSAAQSLLLVEQNTKPFTLLNMRGIKMKKNSHEWIVGKQNKGTAWYKIWNGAMKETIKENHVNLIYGHWAGKGLMVNPHSIGLDSGCVYGKRLSALVLSSTETNSSPLSPSSTRLKKIPPSTTRIKQRQRGVAEKDPEKEQELGFDGARARLKQNVELEEEEDEEEKEELEESTAAKSSSSSQFEEEAVKIAGRNGWIVSVSCAG